MNYIASLPWYDHPSSAEVLDRFWDELRSRLVTAGLSGLPGELNRTLSLPAQWQNPDLLLSQCCGPDLFAGMASTVSCLGRPVFSDLDCPAGYYFSHIVSRGELKPRPSIAINSPTSWSGDTALKNWLNEREILYADCVVSGSHRSSLSLLLRGQVDLVAIDAHTWNLLDTEGVEIIGRSDIALTPPFISAVQDRTTRGVIEEALRACIQVHGESIGLSRLLRVSKQDYAAFVSPDKPQGVKNPCHPTRLRAVN